LDLSDWSGTGDGRGVCAVYEEELSFTRRIFSIIAEMTDKITQGLLDSLTEQAKASPRLRMNLDLRNSAEDQSQRMLNAIEPGSPLPIHRHRKSSETVVCLRGRLVEEYYDELERTCTEAIELSPNGPVVALNIPIGQWHTVRVIESGTVIMEMKNGPYEPLGEEDILSL
jgi:cupin fold WbuC family metalloprotein